MSNDRRYFIGGSDIAAIIGVSPWKSAVDLWFEKTSPEINDYENQKAKARGKRLEPYIIDMIREEHGLDVFCTNQRYADTDVAFFSCEIDAECAIDNDDVDNIEIKTVHPFKAKEWGEHGTDQLPVNYVAQAQWGLGITKRDICRVFALIGDDLKQYIVERDDELIAAMRQKALEFWNEYVQKMICPPLTFDDPIDTIETLKRLYPGTNGDVLDATPMQEHWRAVYENAKELRDKYEDIVNGAKAHLLAEMKDATAIRFSDDKDFIRKLIKKKAYSVNYEASQYFDFRLSKLKES